MGSDGQRPKQKYNLPIPIEIELSDLDAELNAFRLKWPIGKGGRGPVEHFKRAAKLVWPKLKWHDWMEMRVHAACNYPTNSWVGCGAAGKTFDAGVYAMLWWLVDPMNSVVILTSTTGRMVRKRIWPVIQQLYIDCPGFPGNLVDSKTTLQARKGDDKHGIFAMAVREGSTAKAVANIQGVHAPRMLLVIDEATDTPEAIFEAIANLRKGCIEFQLIFIGNPVSHLDPHGIVCEPRGGWDSVSVEDEEWETKGVSKWEIEPGICLHFDGFKSPNVKLGRREFPFLISQEDVERARLQHHSEESIRFWKYTRGFWAPQGLCKTVLSEPLLVTHDARGKLVFMSQATPIIGMDPAFGGDQCMLYIGMMGDLADGRTGIQLTKKINIVTKPSKKDPVEYQIARQAIQIAKDHKVAAECFGLDSTSQGGAVASVMQQEWDPNIVRVDFGGAPTDRPVSREDPRPAKEAYDRRVTELWFTVREFVISGQLKGLDREECVQFCAREFRDERRKIVLETKLETKQKIGRSPDDADAVAVLVEVARQRGASPGGQGAFREAQAWEAQVRDANAVFEEVAYEPEEEWEEEEAV